MQTIAPPKLLRDEPLLSPIGVELWSVLSALENKLNSFTDPEDDALKNYIPAVGNICLAKRENRWQRVKILTVDSTEKKCQVLCLDYGSFDCISFINVRPWCSIAMKLPFQGILCSLPDVAPTGEHWSESNSVFWNVLRGMRLHAKVLAQTKSDEATEARVKIIERIKILLDNPAESLCELNAISSVCRLLRFLSSPGEQADLVTALARASSYSLRHFEKFKEEKGIHILLYILQGTTDEKLQQAICSSLKILGNNKGVSLILNTDFVKHLCQLLKQPENVSNSAVEALSIYLNSDSISKEVENQAVRHLCEKLQGSQNQKMLGTILAILDHLSMRSDNIDVMVAARITETLERLLSTQTSSVIQKYLNKLKILLSKNKVWTSITQSCTDLKEQKNGNSLKNEKPTVPNGLHPEINWHQKPDTITLKVRIRNVTQPKCEFRSDQVIFSAFVGDKFYVADLELYDKILTDKSVYVIKYGEPVITLVKENKGAWCSLLKKKNIHVTFDFEHLEEVEEKHLPSGKMRFRHNVHNCYFSTAIITKSYT
nr:PREDICTED: uncharacterized protein LOC106705209 [Latimeria chalumnae]|eukprot:XP_014349484.1 PREDICTED: uncharacterized protein LOC106705209 [Latimeria chalumnae]